MTRFSKLTPLLLLIPFSPDDFIGGAASAIRRLAQCAQRNQCIDVAQGGVGGTLGNGCPLAAGELPIKTIQQSVEQFDLSLIDGCARPALPESGFDQDSVKRVLGAVYRTV